MKTDALDQFLAQCIQCFRQSVPLPEWPEDIDLNADETSERITFHGIALLLVDAAPGFQGWPSDAVELVKEEARLQSFWELSHREVMSELVQALHQAGITAVLLKGTALAYSLYPKPELRRRGDSDLLIENADRAKVRRVFEACGFSLCSDVRPLQESWQSSANLGFTHTVDLHWRMSASAAISGLLEANGHQRGQVSLPALDESAFGIGSVENLILICINRAQHERLGYLIGPKRVYGSNRLIWAIDIELIAASFAETDWAELIISAQTSGASDIVASGLKMAKRVLETPVPDGVLEQLDQQAPRAEITTYLDCKSARKRLMMDLAACPSLRDKLRLLTFKLHPSDDLIRERFPDANGWPMAALRVRRLVEGFGRMLKGRV
ncbi:MAG: nucleotidyltransferase family protein [Pseudomonadota bacterium]